MVASDCQKLSFVRACDRMNFCYFFSKFDQIDHHTPAARVSRFGSILIY